MNDTAQTIIRSILKIGSGWLLAEGFADSTTSEALAGGILALISIIWGVLHRSKPKEDGSLS